MTKFKNDFTEVEYRVFKPDESVAWFCENPILSGEEHVYDLPKTCSAVRSDVRGGAWPEGNYDTGRFLCRGCYNKWLAVQEKKKLYTPEADRSYACEHPVHPVPSSDHYKWCGQRASWKLIHQTGVSKNNWLCDEHYKLVCKQDIPANAQLEMKELIAQAKPEELSIIIGRAVEAAIAKGNAGLARRLSVEFELYGESKRKELEALCKLIGPPPKRKREKKSA